MFCHVLFSAQRSHNTVKRKERVSSLLLVKVMDIREQGKQGRVEKRVPPGLDGLLLACPGRGGAVASITHSITSSPLSLPTLPTRPNSPWNGEHLPTASSRPPSPHIRQCPCPLNLFRNGSFEGHQGPLLTKSAASSAHLKNFNFNILDLLLFEV